MVLWRHRSVVDDTDGETCCVVKVSSLVVSLQDSRGSHSTSTPVLPSQVPSTLHNCFQLPKLCSLQLSLCSELARHGASADPTHFSKDAMARNLPAKFQFLERLTSTVSARKWAASDLEKAGKEVTPLVRHLQAILSNRWVCVVFRDHALIIAGHVLVLINAHLCYRDIMRRSIPRHNPPEGNPMTTRWTVQYGSRRYVTNLCSFLWRSKKLVSNFSVFLLAACFEKTLWLTWGLITL